MYNCDWEPFGDGDWKDDGLMKTGDWGAPGDPPFIVRMLVSDLGWIRLFLGTEACGLYMAYWADIFRFCSLGPSSNGASEGGGCGRSLWSHPEGDV